MAANATLQVRLNGGAPATGGIVAALNDDVQLTAADKSGWGAPVTKWEIPSYPPGFALPSGWSADADGRYYFLGSADPPPFELTLWGKYMLRLTVLNTIEDVSTAIEVLSPAGLHDYGRGESNQFGGVRDDNVDPFRRNLRTIETMVGASAGDTANTANAVVKRDGAGDIILVQGKALTIASGGGPVQLTVTSEGACFGGTPEADQDGCTKFVGVSGPSGNPTSGSVFIWFDTDDGIFKLRTSAGVDIALDDKAIFDTITSNGTTLTYDGKVKVFASSAATATVPAGVAGQVFVLKALVACTLSRTGGDTFDAAGTSLPMAAGDSRTIMYDAANTRWLVF